MHSYVNILGHGVLLGEKLLNKLKLLLLLLMPLFLNLDRIHVLFLPLLHLPFQPAARGLLGHRVLPCNAKIEIATVISCGDKCIAMAEGRQRGVTIMLKNEVGVGRCETKIGVLGASGWGDGAEL